MDLERGIIKALFYDFPLERFVDIIEKKSNNSFYATVPHLMKWDMPAFDKNELQQSLETYIRQWQKDYNEYNELVRPLLFIASIAGKLLTLEGNKPKVRDGQLLRWRMISHFVSEDLLSLSWLAAREKEHAARENFVWEDTIPITRQEWDSLCDGSKLYDLHSHLGSSSDAFNIRWIYWMNKCCGRPMKQNAPSPFSYETFKREESLDRSMSLWNSSIHPLTMMQWAGVASIIRYYIYVIDSGGHIAEGDMRDITDALHDDNLLLVLLSNMYGKVDGARNGSMMPNFGQIEHWDYAIDKELAIPAADLSSPYMLHVGERKLLYTFFRMLYQAHPVALEFSNLFYLYLLIKVRCRREFIHTNKLRGLSNYQNYEWNNSKHGLINLSEARKRYAIQTALGNHRQNYLESRISWDWDVRGMKNPVPSVYVEKSLFGHTTYNLKTLLRQVRLVVSYSKNDFPLEKKSVGLKKLIETFNQIIARVKRNRILIDKEFSIVGIDFTGSDRIVRPEIYAQLIRYARHYADLPFKQFTYHVGEDFYDLMDGLRTIDEVLRFLEWDRHCRLGHSLALAVQVTPYYENRGWYVIAPRQVLLDNLVWFVDMTARAGFMITDKLRNELHDEASMLYDEIGYSGAFELDLYVQSMRLRADHPVGAGLAEGRNAFVRAALSNDVTLVGLRNNQQVKSLFEEYYSDQDIHRKGSETIFWKMPKQVVAGIRVIQQNLLAEIARKGISIETCPTSNYVIGSFDKYIQLPLFTFVDQLRDNAISINTDDKGVISTSIENEYALIGEAMKKEGHDTASIQIVMSRIRNDAAKSKFRFVS